MLVSRDAHPADSVVALPGGVAVGGAPLAVIAGPCAVESREQMHAVAGRLQVAGAAMLRGGAFKMRSSPYAFQGLAEEGLAILREAGDAVGLPVVSEITSVRQIPLFAASVDVIQVGARSMQNFELLRELGGTRKPILLKRGFANTIEEWLLSAETIAACGNANVILCERGIRTFETATRNTLDLSAVVAVKRRSHLPVIVDPSHASGAAWMVEPLSLAAIAAGADGLLIEVHADPENARSDAQQAITPSEFETLMDKLRALAPLVGRSV